MVELSVDSAPWMKIRDRAVTDLRSECEYKDSGYTSFARRLERTASPARCLADIATAWIVPIQIRVEAAVESLRIAAMDQGADRDFNRVVCFVKEAHPEIASKFCMAIFKSAKESLITGDSVPGLVELQRFHECMQAQKQISSAVNETGKLPNREKRISALRELRLNPETPTEVLSAIRPVLEAHDRWPRLARLWAAVVRLWRSGSYWEDH